MSSGIIKFRGISKNINFDVSSEAVKIKEMKNKKGFTLVELMIVMGISAILALITVPSMMNWYKKDKFINQTREIIDTINDARAAALSNKKCSDGLSTRGWSFSFITDSGGQDILPENLWKYKIELVCLSDVTAPTEKKIILDKNIKPTSIFYVDNSGASHQVLLPTSFLINFIPNKSSPSISLGVNSEDAQVDVFDYTAKKIELSFESLDDPETKRTICFDRISGFPTISKTASCAE